MKEKVKDIISKMTLEEKVSQMVHEAKAVERLGIAEYNWWNESLHGVARAGIATVFPQAIALAATFDEELVYEVADAISTEARAKYNMQQRYGDRGIYKGLTFYAPNVNIFRDPRWGRGHETYGEDPYLTGRLGAAYIRGMQGDNEKYLKTAACAKHFAVHSGPESMRHMFDAQVSEQDLRETYLPAFKVCVQEAKVEAVMGAYNRLDGQPCCGNKRLLIEILRDEWGFDGMVVSDFLALLDFHGGHEVTDNPVDSAAMALMNGCDFNLGVVFPNLVEAFKENKVSMERIDEALERIFMTRMKLGILGDADDNPYNQIPYSVVDSDEMKKLNERAAEKSVVLLKNKDNILPLDKNKIKTIAVLGPNADNRRSLDGNYEGTSSRYITVLEGIQDYVGDDVRVLYSEGCHLFRDQINQMAVKCDRVAEIKEICSESDVVIAVMGLDATLEGEDGDTGSDYGMGDKPYLHLPGIQTEVLKIAKESGKPVILVNMTGSAMTLNWEEENLDGIIQGWYPGARGGKAIARLLFGEADFEGKLPVTFYRTMEELPEFTDYSMKNRTYRYMKNEALYPFGYGLSYTKFEYENTVLIEDADHVDIKTIIKNTGKMDGTETVQVYVGAREEWVPNPQLKKIKKVFLKKGESKEIEVILTKEDFYIFDESGNPVISKEYDIYIGGSQPDSRSEKLLERKPVHMEVKECFMQE